MTDFLRQSIQHQSTKTKSLRITDVNCKEIYILQKNAKKCNKCEKKH